MVVWPGRPMQQRAQTPLSLRVFKEEERMRKRSVICVAPAIAAILFVAVPHNLSAAESFNPVNWLKGIVSPEPAVCEECGQSHDAGADCVEVVPVEKCVTGKKKVYDAKIRYEYVTIPETRYRWKTRLVTKEIPCDYCKPVCDTKQVDHHYGVERWEKEDLGCSELHCKICETKTEKVPCKQCKLEPGKTTIKARYWEYVKEPYTVYRQIKRPVCVKQPRYERVEVLITTHVCRHCNGGGCDLCGY